MFNINKKNYRLYYILEKTGQKSKYILNWKVDINKKKFYKIIDKILSLA